MNATVLQLDMQGSAPKRRSLIEALSAKGVRLTPQRRALIEVIEESSGHLDAAVLLDRARQRQPKIDRATVYRTVELLRKFRLTRESDRVRLACLGCGRVEEFSKPLYEALNAEIARAAGFRVSVMRLEGDGLCRACAREQEQENVT